MIMCVSFSLLFSVFVFYYLLVVVGGGGGFQAEHGVQVVKRQFPLRVEALCVCVYAYACLSMHANIIMKNSTAITPAHTFSFSWGRDSGSLTGKGSVLSSSSGMEVEKVSFKRHVALIGTETLLRWARVPMAVVGRSICWRTSIPCGSEEERFEEGVGVGARAAIGTRSVRKEKVMRVNALSIFET